MNIRNQDRTGSGPNFVVQQNSEILIVEEELPSGKVNAKSVSSRAQDNGKGKERSIIGKNGTSWPDDCVTVKRKTSDVKFNVGDEFCGQSKPLAATSLDEPNASRFRFGPISQFSALKLRRAFQLSGATNGPTPQHHQPIMSLAIKDSKGKSLRGGNLSSSSASSVTAPVSGSAPESPRSVHPGDALSSAGCETLSSSRGGLSMRDCCCCCCSAKCTTSTLSSRIESGLGADSCGLWRRDTFVGRPAANQPTDRFNVISSATRRHRQRRTRKPIPVPPPIVPLHRQLAFGLQDPMIVGDIQENCGSILEASGKTNVTFRLDSGGDRRRFRRDHHFVRPKGHEPSAATGGHRGQPLAELVPCSMATKVPAHKVNWTQLSRSESGKSNSAARPDPYPRASEDPEQCSTAPCPSSDGGLYLEGDSTGASSLKNAHTADMVRPSGLGQLLGEATGAGGIRSVCDGDSSGELSGIGANMTTTICVGEQSQAKNAQKHSLVDVPHRQKIIASCIGMRSRQSEMELFRASMINSDLSSTIVDFRSEPNNAVLPQATQQAPDRTGTAADSTKLSPSSTDNRHCERSSEWPAYDLPESGAARGLLRASPTEAERAATARRLPLRPARRPSEAPPPPPAGRALAEGVGANGDCVLANLFEPKSTLGLNFLSANNHNDCKTATNQISTRNLSPQARTFSLENRSPLGLRSTRQKSKESKPLSALLRYNLDNVGPAKNEPHKGPPTRVNQPDQSHKNKVAARLLCHQTPSNGPTDSAIDDQSSKQNGQPSGASTRDFQLIPDEGHKNSSSHELSTELDDNPRSGADSKQKSIRQRQSIDIADRPEISSDRSPKVVSSELKDMGSSHSSSAATVAKSSSDIQQRNKVDHQSISNVGTTDRKRKITEPAVATLTKDCSRDERHNSNGKKRDSCDADISADDDTGKQAASRTTTSRTTASNEVAAPQIIKSLSNMTNKLVGEAKLMTGILKDTSGHHQAANLDEADGCSGAVGGAGGKQHVQSALQMCIKGVVKPSNRKAHQEPSPAAGNRRARNHHQASGCLLENPSLGMEDSLARRRKSLQDGDVFIYPRLYKDLNECRKCLRDNRICNCIEIELSSDGSSSAEKLSSTSPNPEASPIRATSIRPQGHNSSSTFDSVTPIIREGKQQSTDQSSSPVTIPDHGSAAGRPPTIAGDDDQSGQPVCKINITTVSMEQLSKYSKPTSNGSSISNSTTTITDVNNNSAIGSESRLSLVSNQMSGHELGLSPTSRGFHSRHNGNESNHDGSENLSANRSPCKSTNSEPSLISNIELIEDPRNSSPQASPLSRVDEFYADLTANLSKVPGDRKISTVADLSPSRLSQEHRDRPTADRKLSSSEASASLSPEDEVKHSPSSMTSQTPLSSPTRLKTKVTTISIGSPTRHRCQEQLDESNTNNDSRRLSSSEISNQEEANVQEQPNGSIISIQTQRKAMTTKLIEREAIYDDIDDYDEEGTCRNIEPTGSLNKITATSLVAPNTRGIVVVSSPSTDRQLLLSEPITIRNSLSPIRNDSGLGSAVLDYSPILSSVRDYIKNMNTELQVQTSIASSCRTDNLITTSGSGLGSGAVQSAISASDLVVVSAPTIPCSLANGSQSLAGLERPIQLVSSKTAGIVQTTFTTALPAASIKAHVQTSSSCASTAELDSSLKKSIFDGASKDEILEYLEDARERVPEILMAADDVMVISENELIVVNQLEPGSPATPISIVETSEVIGEGPGGDCNEEISINSDCSPLMCPNLRSGQQSQHGLTHPDQLRQHLEQMYQTSQLAAAAAQTDSPSGFGSNETSNEATNKSLKADSRPSPELGADSVSRYSTEVGANSAPDFGLHNLDKDILEESDISDQEKPNNGKTAHQQHKQQPSPSSARNENISTAIVSQCASIVGLLDFVGPIYSGRRNSVSESLSKPTAGRENAMQILALQKRYTNRNSLSSPPSSPPSSTSPSSSSSSNRTSGNCSAATSFYASSSLSCSSPLLNLNGTFSSLSSPAFNQSAQVAISESGREQQATNLADKLEGYDLRVESSNHNATLDQSGHNRAASSVAGSISRDLFVVSPDLVASANCQEIVSSSVPIKSIDRDGSSFGFEPSGAVNCLRSMIMAQNQVGSKEDAFFADRQTTNGKGSSSSSGTNSETSNLNASNCRPDGTVSAAKLSRIDESAPANKLDKCEPSINKSVPKTNSANSNARFFSQPNKQNSIGIGSSRGHYNTLCRLNNYFMNRHPFSSSSDSTVEFQCLDCDQFIDVDQATIMNKTNELRLLRATDSKGRLDCSQPGGDGQELSPEQLDRAYVAAMNGLPLCKTCEKKRIERKEIISEFVETELKYGRDLKIIHDEFYRPMQIAGLLSKDQINGVFLNLEELIMAHCKFANSLETAIREAHLIGDSDFNTVNIGRIFVESAEMLNTFESYCIRQGAAACLLARLAKERELLRIFLRVSQMENTLLRRMNLAAFLMVPVQRVTKYPLLLNRLYKVTAYHHKDREALRDAQLRVELHLEHINQQTKGIGASNKIWRRISSLSAPISNRRGLMNVEDIGYIKLRKTALDMLKWDRDETQFIHSGKIHFAALTEYLTRQKMKPLRYLPAHALLIVLGRPNWKYRPDLVKANLDSKLMTPTAGGSGIREAALLLFREKNGRFVPCREPLLLSNCVLSADCSQFNNEWPPNQPNIARQNNQPINNSPAAQQHNSGTGSRKSSSSNYGEQAATSDSSQKSDLVRHVESRGLASGSQSGSIDSTTTNRSMSPRNNSTSNDSRTSSLGGDVALISTLRGLIDDGAASGGISGSPPNVSAHNSRSYSLASALPRATLTTTNSAMNLSKPIISTASSNLTILNQLMTKVNNYHNRQSTNSNQGKQATSMSAPGDQPTKKAPVSPSSSVDMSLSNNGSTATTTTPSSNSLTTDLVQQQQRASNCSRLTISSGSASGGSGNGSSGGRAGAVPDSGQPNYNNYHYFHNSHHQPYGDYEESFEMHERVGKESLLMRADTPLKTRYWLQMLRYHAKDLGQWRSRRNGQANIMMMRHE